MKSKTYQVTFSVFLIFAAAVFGQETETHVYKLEWRSATEILEVIDPLLLPPADARASHTFNTLTVRAPVDVHRQIRESILPKYDRPPASIEFQFYLLKGSRQEGGFQNGIPERIRAVLDELAGLTAYKSFELLDAPTLRTTEGHLGIVSASGDLSYEIRLLPSRLTGTAHNSIVVENFSLELEVPVRQAPSESHEEQDEARLRSARIGTSFNIENDETVVLGASRIGDNASQAAAVLTVVTARILNAQPD